MEENERWHEGMPSLVFDFITVILNLMGYSVERLTCLVERWYDANVVVQYTQLTESENRV